MFNLLHVFRDALNGNDTALRAEAGPDAVLCVAPELASVLVVRPDADADGAQQGWLARVGEGGGGEVGVVDVPRSFDVREIDHNGERFVVTSADGRTVAATPAQFGLHPRIINASHNPEYEPQLEALFLATGGLAVPPPYDGFVAPPAADLGLSEPAEIISRGEAYVTIDGEEVLVQFDCADADVVVERLPQARALLAGLTDLVRAGAEFAWEWSAESDETEADKASFVTEMQPAALTLYLTRDFQIDYVPTQYTPDGYWFAVQFTRDGKPVDLSVEC